MTSGELSLHLRLDTPIEKLKLVPDLLKSIVESSSPKAQFGFAGLLEITTQSLLIFCSYQYNHPDISKFKTNHCKINMATLAALAGMDIEVGYLRLSSVFPSSLLP